MALNLKRNPIINNGALVGAAFMALFAVVSAWRWLHTGSLFYALLLLRDGMWSVFFLVRRPALKTGSRVEAVLAYVSTALPLFYFSPGGMVSWWLPVVANALAVIGFLLATLATIELGVKLGVAPAARGEKCRNGVYRWLKHPMYSGYIIAEAGWILLYPANAILFIASVACYACRMRAENRVLRHDVEAFASA